MGARGKEMCMLLIWGSCTSCLLEGFWPERMFRCEKGVCFIIAREHPWMDAAEGIGRVGRAFGVFGE